MEKVVDNWLIILTGGSYTPPELRRWRLQGIASWIEGDRNYITTSPLVDSEEDGKVLVTRSGSRYILGEPASEDQKTFDELRAESPEIPCE